MKITKIQGYKLNARILCSEYNNTIIQRWMNARIQNTRKHEYMDSDIDKNKGI